MRQGCGLSPLSGPTQVPTNECTGKWEKQTDLSLSLSVSVSLSLSLSVCLSLSLSLSLSQNQSVKESLKGNT